MRAHHGADGGAAVGLHDDAVARDAAATVAASSVGRAGSVCARPTGVSLTGDEPGSRSGVGRSQLQHQPVGHDLDAGVAVERRRAPDRWPQTRACRARRDTPASSRSSAGRTSALASAPASAPVASTSTSRSSDAIARRCDASCSRSSRRRGFASAAASCASRIASPRLEHALRDSRASTSSPRSPSACPSCRRPSRDGARVGSSTVRISAPRCLGDSGGTAAADSATAPSAAACRAAPSPG